MSIRAERLLELGQSVWLDFIRRGHLVSGEFDRLVREAGVVGVTSNPTIFQLAIAESTDYEEALAARVADGLSGPALFEAIAVEDIQMACDRLRAVWERTGHRDGRVSIEVSPTQAHDTAGTLAEARRLHASVARGNVLIKVPATPEGIPAIADLTAEGISVNVTLIFSLARYRQVMDAYLSGLERRAAAGGTLADIFSVASFFVSRVDNKADAAIARAAEANPSAKAELESYLGKSAIANARLAYAEFTKVTASPRFAALQARGANVQRPLWASTSTKNKAYPDTLYVDELIGPDTVNTMPPQTLTAFNDHGRLEVTIGRDLDGAHRLFDRLPKLGVPIETLIDQLEPEGVASFAASYTSLLETLETRRREVAAARGACRPARPARRARLGRPEPTAISLPMDLALGRHPGPAVEARLAGLEADRLPARLWSRDPTLWSADPARHPAILNRLGWLGAPGTMAERAAGFRAFAAGAVADGFTHAVLLGMGGSSLAPEVMRVTLGVAPGALDLTVLDDTSPGAVGAALRAHDPRRTLVLVSSKSGSTIEVVSFERCFHAWQAEARGAAAGKAFAAITDPGTRLEALARSRGYRAAFPGQPDIGGRYSAISPFGLVPAALLGADLDRLIGAARAETDPLREGRPVREVPGVVLGAVLGELALRERDKLTLVADGRWAALGVWIEQLVAESTGKEGRGIVPVVEESLAAPDRYGDDRLFVALGAFADDSATGQALAALRDAGHPVVAWDPAPHGLGGEFMRWEIATATAAAILGIDPFDEPNVAEAKQATQSVLEGYLVSGRFPADAPLVAAEGLEAHAPPGLVARLKLHTPAPADPAAWLTALLSLARPGDYLSVLAWFHRTGARHDRLQRLREAVRETTRLATTLGYGPRYLHSTGQLHKGGADTGLFLQLTAEPDEERPIPEERFGFGVLQRAQAEGDYAALERRERRVLRIHLGAAVEAGLDALIATVAAGERL